MPWNDSSCRARHERNDDPARGPELAPAVTVRAGWLPSRSRRIRGMSELLNCAPCAVPTSNVKGETHDRYGNQSIIDQYHSHAIH
jgi:hypothetical protein